MKRILKRFGWTFFCIILFLYLFFVGQPANNATELDDRVTLVSFIAYLWAAPKIAFWFVSWFVRTIDPLGAALLAALVALAIGEAYAALHFGWFRSPWELAAVLFVGGCFVAFVIGMQGTAPPPLNPQVHGTAKPADARETKAAARGDTKAPLHGQDFED